MGVYLGKYELRKKLSNDDTGSEDQLRERSGEDQWAQVGVQPDGLSGGSGIGIEYPAQAIRGEMLLRFADRDSLDAYLAALSRAGITPLGSIDELLVLRINEADLHAVDPSEYGALPGFSYKVERPQPPREISPEALSSLQAYGRSAREIVGQAVGDGHGVIVAILDSGIAEHPQFDDVYIVHIDLVGGGVDGPGAAHGTSVASIISGREGIAPAAELFVVRVLDDNGIGSSFHVAEGLVQAVDLGVKVVNMSLGLYQNSEVLREAVRYAHSKGVLIVAAAGNDGYTRLPYPAAYPEVIAVTAVDANGRQALFPNQSKSIDFAAPGFGILAAQDEEGTALFTGTSAAAPFISGTLAALLSSDPNLTPEQAVERMKLYRDEAGAAGVDPVYGGGVMDWDRLREYATPGVVDVALAEIYMRPDAEPGTTMPVEIIVENRGTRWLTGAKLEVAVGEAEPLDFSLESIGPGQSVSRKIYAKVPSIKDASLLQVAAQVLTESVVDDVRPANNMKAVAYRPVSN